MGKNHRMVHVLEHDFSALAPAFDHLKLHVGPFLIFQRKIRPLVFNLRIWERDNTTHPKQL